MRCNSRKSVKQLERLATAIMTRWLGYKSQSPNVNDQPVRAPASATAAQNAHRPHFSDRMEIGMPLPQVPHPEDAVSFMWMLLNNCRRSG